MRIILSLSSCLLTCYLFSQEINFDEFRRLQLNSENFRNTIEFSMEPSTISGTKFTDYHSGIKKAFIFNGDFRMPITAGGENFVTGKRRFLFHVVQFVPHASIRIFDNDPKWNDKSKPVRTPSFFPKVYYYVSNANFWNPSKLNKYFLGAGILHHSNGQDGTEFVDYSDTVNIYDGSFSESLILHFLFGGSRKFLGKNSRESKKELNFRNQNKLHFKKENTNFELLYKFGMEFHPKYFSNQKFFETGIYGGNRIFTNLIWKKSANHSSYFFENNSWRKKPLNVLKESWRICLNAEYITDLSFYSGSFNNLQEVKFSKLEKRLNVNLSFYKRILESKYPAVFAQLGYYGSDNYNIYFQKSMFTVRIGLAFSFFEYSKT